MADLSPVDKILGHKPTGPIDKVWESIENVYGSIGLMGGDSAPAKRFIFGNLVGSGIMMTVKPSFAYYKGQPRPWALTSPGSQMKTALPWWMPGLAFGFFSGFLV